MKKWMISSFVIMLGMILTACGSEEQANGHADKGEENVFSQEDIENAEEMTRFLDEKMEEFEVKADELIENEEIEIDDESLFDEEMKKLADEIVTQPFLTEFEGSIIPEEFRGEEQVNVYFNKTSSEPCSLGFCEYDGIEVMDVEYDFENREEYSSKHFQSTELIFNDVKYDYQNDEEEEEKDTNIRFVKSKDGKLILTKHPYLSFTSLNLKEYDQEFESIKTSVPESEVEAEQGEYKAEVEETLSKFPELQ